MTDSIKCQNCGNPIAGEPFTIKTGKGKKASTESFHSTAEECAASNPAHWLGIRRRAAKSVSV